MDATILDYWLLTRVVEARLAKSFGRDSNDVFLLGVLGSELRLHRRFPFTFHNLFNAGFAETIPFSAQARFAHVLKILVNEDSATETTCMARLRLVIDSTWGR
jgi:hypothetical protein